MQLTLEPRSDSLVQDVVVMEFSTPEEATEILVVCSAEGFREETGVITRTIQAYETHDLQAAQFSLTPEKDVEPGVKRISLDFYLRSRLALSSTFEVVIEGRRPAQRVQAVPVKPRIEGQRQGEESQVVSRLILEKSVVPVPDLVLRIAMSADGRELSFTLDSPSGRFDYHQKAFGSVQFPERKSLSDFGVQSPERTSLSEFLELTYLDLNSLAGSGINRRTPQQTEANKKQIDKIGWNLYEQWFPQALKDEWRRIQEVRAGRDTLSLLIISDELWIPWEMVHTYSTDEKGDFIAEGFLCEQFQMSRWIAGQGLPETIALTSAVLVSPKSNLSAVKKEKAYFAELAETQPRIKIDPKPLESRGASRRSSCRREGPTLSLRLS